VPAPIRGNRPPNDHTRPGFDAVFRIRPPDYKTETVIQSYPRDERERRVPRQALVPSPESRVPRAHPSPEFRVPSPELALDAFRYLGSPGIAAVLD
jgi:hypothetical protein